jgi:hypothetical protein
VSIRRYLSPEPYLQKAWWVRASAEQGGATPTYAYGGNNPVRNTDPTGLFQLAPGSTCGNWPFAVALAKEWAGCKKGRIRSAITVDPSDGCSATQRRWRHERRGLRECESGSGVA